MMPLTWNSGRISRLWSSPGDAQRPARHLAHRGDVGVIEHHALGLAGRPARVDQQRERIGTQLDGHAMEGRLRGERADLDDGGVELEPIGDHDLGACVVDLELHLRPGQRGVDRRRGRAEPPGGEQRDDELDAVREGDRDDVVLAHAEAREQRRGAGHALGERGVVERDRVVGDRRGVGLCGGARVGQRGRRDAQGRGHGFSSLFWVGTGTGRRRPAPALVDHAGAPQRGLGGVVAAHAVGAGARRRGRRAQVDARDAGAVGVERHPRPEDHLPRVVGAGDDVAADVVGVVRLHRRHAADVPGEDAFAEAGREALDLRLDRLGGVARRSRPARARTRTGDGRRRWSGSGRRGTAGRRARTGARACCPGTPCARPRRSRARCRRRAPYPRAATPHASTARLPRSRSRP